MQKSWKVGCAWPFLCVLLLQGLCQTLLNKNTTYIMTYLMPFYLHMMTRSPKLVTTDKSSEEVQIMQCWRLTLRFFLSQKTHQLSLLNLLLYCYCRGTNCQVISRTLVGCMWDTSSKLSHSMFQWKWKYLLRVTTGCAGSTLRVTYPLCHNVRYVTSLSCCVPCSLCHNPDMSQ